MTTETEGRRVISCDRCHARLDLGPATANPYRNRMPSGWLTTGENSHLCGLCSQGHTAKFIRRYD
jgi:hypothetical protein